MPEPKDGVDAINNLRGSVVEVQHGIDDGFLVEMLKHLSGLGHLEVLGIAKNSAPIKGDYNAWLSSPAGQKSERQKALNEKYNLLIRKLFNAYQAADKLKRENKAAELKAKVKEAVGIVTTFEHENHTEGFKHWAKVTAAKEKAKPFM